VILLESVMMKFKKGTGAKYVSDVDPINLTISHYVYSLANDEKIIINI
jgi:hypothetical protein